MDLLFLFPFVLRIDLGLELAHPGPADRFLF